MQVCGSHDLTKRGGREREGSDCKSCHTPHGRPHLLLSKTSSYVGPSDHAGRPRCGAESGEVKVRI